MAHGPGQNLLAGIKLTQRDELSNALFELIEASNDQKRNIVLNEAESGVTMKARDLLDQVKRGRRIYEGVPSTLKKQKGGADTPAGYIRPSFFVPYAWSHIETAKTRWYDALFATRPYIQIMAEAPSDSDRAVAFERFMDYGMDAVGFHRAFRRYIQRAAVDGTHCVFLYWDHDKEFVNSLGVHVEDFWIDPLCENIQDARFVARRFTKRPKELKFLKTADFDPQKEYTSVIERHPAMFGELREQNTVDIVEVWFKALDLPGTEDDHPEQIYQAWLLTVGEGDPFPTRGRLIRLERSPYWIRDFPFLKITPVPRPSSPWGYSLVERVAALNEEINHLKNTRAVGRSYAQTPVFEQSPDNPYHHNANHVALEPGGIIPAGLTMKPLPDVSANVPAEVRSILGEMQEILGTHDVVTGKTTTSRQTARESLLKSEGANLRLNEAAQEIGTSLKEYAEFAAAAVLQFRTQPADFINVAGDKRERGKFDRDELIPSRIREEHKAYPYIVDPATATPALEALDAAMADHVADGLMKEQVIQEAIAGNLMINRNTVDELIQKHIQNIVRKAYQFRTNDPSIRLNKESKLAVYQQILLPIVQAGGINPLPVIRQVLHLSGENPDMADWALTQQAPGAVPQAGPQQPGPRRMIGQETPQTELEALDRRGGLGGII